MRRVIIFVTCCVMVFSASFAKGQYPLSKKTFKELDYIWSELVSFSQEVYNSISETLLEEQKEPVGILLNDIGDMTFSLLTLITMLELEFIHAEKEQFNSDVITYIIKYSRTLNEIVDMNIQRNNEVVLSSNDVVVVQFYDKTNICLRKAKNALLSAEKELIESEQEYSKQRKEALLKRTPAKVAAESQKYKVSKSADIVKDEGVEKRVIVSEQKDETDEIPPEGSWSITRYNPKTGYIKYYTSDGKYVGKRKK